MSYRFDRMECAGSLGDLGTLLPLAIGMILLNGLHPTGVFLSVGLLYGLSGAYFRTTVPVQPMKVVGAYAIATGMAGTQVLASGFLMGMFLLLMGGAGAIDRIARYVPKPVVRGVQLSTGVLLMGEGVRFVLGTSHFQSLRGAGEPFLSIQSLGPVPIGWVIGAVGGAVALLFLENRRVPAGLLLVVGGSLLGAGLGGYRGFENLHPGLHLPEILPLGFPSAGDLGTAFLLLVLPQIPMTLGNAVYAYVDLSKEYLGDGASRLNYRSACISMGLANLASFLLGGMPLCHGAGGLAAHYRFGARTAGSNLMVGGFFLILALLFGSDALPLLCLLPMSVLGVLLFFAGGELALSVMDLREREDFWVVFTVLGVALASNLGIGFLTGIALACALKWREPMRRFSSARFRRRS